MTANYHTTSEGFRLVFADSGPVKPVELGPFSEVRMDATYMRADGAEIAEHRDHCWYVKDKRYFRLDCEGMVIAWFESPDGRSERLGPYMHFSSADGMAYGDGIDVAHVDPFSGCWYDRRHNKQWKELVLQRA